MSSDRAYVFKQRHESTTSTNTHEQRINKIFDRLTDIRSGVELQKDRKTEEMTERLEDLFDRLQDFEQTMGRSLVELKEHIVSLEELVERPQGQFANRQRSQEVKKLQDRYSYLIESQMVDRKESEIAISRLLQEKCNVIAVQIIQQNQKREETVADLKSSLASDLPRLSAEIQEQEKNREYCDTEMMEEIAEGLSLCTAQIDSIKQQREQCEESTYQMMKEVLVRVGEELLIERKTREGTEENILVLIEGMCDKVSPSDR